MDSAQIGTKEYYRLAIRFPIKFDAKKCVAQLRFPNQISLMRFYPSSLFFFPYPFLLIHLLKFKQNNYL